MFSRSFMFVLHLASFVYYAGFDAAANQYQQQQNPANESHDWCCRRCRSCFLTVRTRKLYGTLARCTVRRFVVFTSAAILTRILEFTFRATELRTRKLYGTLARCTVRRFVVFTSAAILTRILEFTFRATEPNLAHATIAAGIDHMLASGAISTRVVARVNVICRSERHA